MIATCAAKLWIHGYTGKARCRRCASQHAAGTKQTLDQYQNLGFQVTSRGQVGFDRFWDVLAAVIRGHSVCPYIEPKCLFRRHPWSSSRSQERLLRSAAKARGQVKTLLDRPRSHRGPPRSSRGQAKSMPFASTPLGTSCVQGRSCRHRRKICCTKAAASCFSKATISSWTKIFTKHVFFSCFFHSSHLLLLFAQKT